MNEGEGSFHPASVSTALNMSKAIAEQVYSNGTVAFRLPEAAASNLLYAMTNIIGAVFDSSAKLLDALRERDSQDDWEPTAALLEAADQLIEVVYLLQSMFPGGSLSDYISLTRKIMDALVSSTMAEQLPGEEPLQFASSRSTVSVATHSTSTDADVNSGTNAVSFASTSFLAQQQSEKYLTRVETWTGVNPHRFAEDLEGLLELLLEGSWNETVSGRLLQGADDRSCSDTSGAVVSASVLDPDTSEEVPVEGLTDPLVVRITLPTGSTPTTTDFACTYWNEDLGCWEGRGMTLLRYEWNGELLEAVCATLHLSDFSGVATFAGITVNSVNIAADAGLLSHLLDPVNLLITLLLFGLALFFIVSIVLAACDGRHTIQRLAMLETSKELMLQYGTMRAKLHMRVRHAAYASLVQEGGGPQTRSVWQDCWCCGLERCWKRKRDPLYALYYKSGKRTHVTPLKDLETDKGESEKSQIDKALSLAQPSPAAVVPAQQSFTVTQAWQADDDNSRGRSSSSSSSRSKKSSEKRERAGSQASGADNDKPRSRLVRALRFLLNLLILFLENVRRTHIWTSIFWAPWEALVVFSRTQRMTVLGTMMVSSMAVGAVLYGSQPVGITQRIVRVLISTLSMLPASFIFPFLFKRVC